ncbi:EF-hand domain-containing family member C2 isoform X2 [Mobula birostris]|uniref:EF-hand domain-containing family member C2 isoform X2 n=1 Tax=Mobula birostris TaxID=1983395 RepID=UPI003B27BC8C
MTLPLLPGNTFNRNLGKEKFHKSHHFDFPNDVPVMVGEEKPGIGGEPLLGQKLKPKFSVFPKGQGSDAPSWVVFDKQVLCFKAYFQESVQERREEQYRIRKCKIYFHLEDDTIQVIEPEVKNSGISQGTIIHRHRIPLPPPYDDQFYTMDHFNLCQEIVFYSKTFMIVDCDQFTKNFLWKMGVKLNPPGCIPEDPYISKREQMEKNMQPLRPYEKTDTLKQFLDHDKHVLRFYCYWDDRETQFGDFRELVLHYYLADDTIEIREVFPPNSGRDAVDVFLNRNKLPKNIPDRLYHPGEITDRTLLNTFGPVGLGGRYILDSLKTGHVQQEFYKDCDLMIGTMINVWGRKVVLCDCDEFTKEYYRKKYGIEDFTPVKYKSEPITKVKREIPPYNGFGSEEDSYNSTLSLEPKPPRRDIIKFMEKDRQGLESNVLRFSARLITNNEINNERNFILSYYLSDDTISIFESPKVNSGITGGKFLERGRIKKPGQELYKSELSDYFTQQDLFIGAKLCFYGNYFCLVDADEYTFCYMEKNADEYQKANICTILTKLKTSGNVHSLEIKRMLAAHDHNRTGIINYDEFRNIIIQIGEGHLTEHEVITMGRYYSIREEQETEVCLILHLVHEVLRKNGFEDFLKISEAFIYEDRQRTGFLPAQETRNILKGFRLPIPNDILEEMISKFQSADGQVAYRNLVLGLNWRENPVPPVDAKVPIKSAALKKEEIITIEENVTQWKSMTLHGRHPYDLSRLHVDKETSNSWLRVGDLFPETE